MDTSENLFKINAEEHGFEKFTIYDPFDHSICGCCCLASKCSQGRCYRFTKLFAIGLLSILVLLMMGFYSTGGLVYDFSNRTSGCTEELSLDGHCTLCSQDHACGDESGTCNDYYIYDPDLGHCAWIDCNLVENSGVAICRAMNAEIFTAGIAVAFFTAAPFVFFISVVEMSYFDSELTWYTIKNQDVLYKVANWWVYILLSLLELLFSKWWFIIVVLFIPIGGFLLLGSLVFVLDAAVFYKKSQKYYLQLLLLSICAVFTMLDLLTSTCVNTDGSGKGGAFGPLGCLDPLEFNVETFGYVYLSSTRIMKESTLFVVIVFTLLSMFNTTVSPDKCFALKLECHIEKVGGMVESDSKDEGSNSEE